MQMNDVLQRGFDAITQIQSINIMEVNVYVEQHQHAILCRALE